MSRDAGTFAPEQYLRAAEASRVGAGRNCLVANALIALDDADGKDLGAAIASLMVGDGRKLVRGALLCDAFGLMEEEADGGKPQELQPQSRSTRWPGVCRGISGLWKAVAISLLFGSCFY